MPRVLGLTEDDIRARWDRVVELSARGVAVKLIAEQLHISERQVLRIRARRMGAKAPRRNFTAEEVAAVETMLTDGVSIREIARTLGRDSRSISRRWPGRGWGRADSAEFGVLRQRLRTEFPGL